MRAAPSTMSGTTWRRLLTAVVAALVPVAGLAAPAHAAVAGSASVVSTNGNAGVHAASNSSTPTVVINTEHSFFYTDGGTRPTITFTRVGTGLPSDTGADSIDFTITGTNASLGTATSFTGTVDLHLANPDDYTVTVTGQSGLDSNTTDSCTGCFSVLSTDPTVTSASVTQIAQGGSATVTFNGTKFARGNYTLPSGADSNYNCSSCTDAPILEIQDAGSPVTGIDVSGDPAASAGGPVEATSTTITKVVSVDASTTPGTYDIYVENTDGKHGLLAGAFEVLPAPAIADVSPATRGANSTGGEIVITGTDFPTDIAGTITAAQGQTNGVTYTFVRDSSTQLRFTNVAVASNATASARIITLTSASRHVTVTDSSSFSVAAAPAPSSVIADDSQVSGNRTYGQNATNVSLTLNGSNFVDGAELTFSPATGITVNSTLVTPTAITADISISDAAAVGNVAVSVVNGDGGTPTATCGTACNLIVRGAPTITSVTPNHGARGGTTSVTITGNNLADSSGLTPPTITFPGGTVSNVVAVNGSKVTGDVNLDATTVGTIDFAVVNNDDLGRSSCAECFSADSLTVSGANKTSALNDAPVYDVIVSGSGFAADATVQLVKTGTGSATVPPIDGVVTAAPSESTPGAADGTSITATFNLQGADPGAYEFRVTNPAGDYAGSGQGGVFSVIADSPSISSVSPDTRGGGAVDQTVVITGSYFGPNAAVSFSNPAVHIDSTTVDSSTQITVVLHVDQISAGDAGTVTVTNTDTNTGSAAFNLVVGPSITGNTPTSIGQGVTGAGFSLTGDQGTFPATADVQLTATGGAGVTFSNIAVTPGDPATSLPPTPATDDTLDATLDVTQGATLGSYDLVLVDSSTGGRDVCSGCLVVTAPPTVDSVTPGFGRLGQDVAVTIAGSDFQTGATVSVSDGITVSNVTVGASSITATFSVPAGGVPGTFADVTVTNPDAGEGVLAGGFEIVEVPDVPTNVQATPGDQQADVSWTAPSDNGLTITKYTVTAVSPTSPTGDVTVEVTGSPAAASTTVTGLVNGVSYTFEVFATNAAGDGATSDPSAAVTPYGLPGQVSNVQATPGDQQADVSWTAPSDNGATITKYTVTAVSPTSPAGDVTDTVTGSPAASSLTLTGLQNGVSYTFEVFATNAAGDGATSAASSPVVPYGVPGQVTNVQATPGDQQADVSWTAPGDNGATITKYTVTAVSPTSPTGDVTVEVTGSPAGTSTTVTGLVNGVSYTFEVFATNAAGDGATSAPSAAVVPFGLPGQVTGVIAAIGDQQADVSWNAPGDNGATITKYTVTAVSPTSPTGDVTDTVTGSPAASSLTLTGLQNGVSYTFEVYATNAAGDGATSDPSTAGVPYGVPAQVTGVTAVAGDQQADVSWTAPSDNGRQIAKYTVTAVSPTSPAGDVTVEVTGSPAATSTTVTGLENGVSYTFEVYATNAAGDGATSAPSAAVVPYGLPGQVTGVTAVAGDQQADVSWTAPGDNGATITTYTVHAISPTSPTGDVTVEVTGSPAATSTTVTGLENGVSYTFEVYATNTAGDGATSDPSAAVTPYGVPAQVTGVTAVAGDQQADVSWTAPSDNGRQITKYTVTAVSPTSPAGDVTVGVTGSPAAASMTVTGLEDGVSYTFEVFATNAAGDGATSDPSAAVTPQSATSLTIDKSRNRITNGRTATLSGTLWETVSGDPVAGQDVELYGMAANASSFELIGTYTTDVDGLWSADVSPSRTTAYYAKFAGAGAEAASQTAETTLNVRYKIAWVTPKPGSTITHGNVAIRVKVRDIVPGAQGKLLIKRANGKVVQLDAANVNAKGFITFHAFISKGQHRIAVKVMAKDGFVGTKTRFISFTAS